MRHLRDALLHESRLDDNVKTLLDFKARLRALKHYPTHYRNAEDLQLQFRWQLELVYGGGDTSSAEITDSTPQSKIDEIALLLCYRQLGDNKVVLKRLNAAVLRASGLVHTAIFNLAEKVRRESWETDKHRLERTIPIFEALVSAEPRWHSTLGNLGFALKDKLNPEFARALDCLTRAVDLRGDDAREGVLYQYSRALCLISLDPHFTSTPPQSADPGIGRTVVETLRKAYRDLDRGGPDWKQIMANPDAADLRRWLDLNGSPDLRS